jgi:hypothetical protein
MSDSKNTTSDSSAIRQALVDNSTPANIDEEVVLQDAATNDLSKTLAWFELKIREYDDVISQRNRWSNILLSLVSLIIIMDFVIMILAGLNILHYTNGLAIPAFIGSSILEIFGLSYIVVQYLFPGGKLPDVKPTNPTS